MAMKRATARIITIASALLIMIGGVDALGFQRVRPNRLPPGQRGQMNPRTLDPQFGQRNNRRQQQNNRIKKQQLQQRLMQTIGLTPDQRFKLQEIRRGREDEVIAAGRRLRQARQRLEGAIWANRYDEESVKQAIEEMAAAQANKIRVDARVRAEQRTILTEDQVTRLLELQREIRRENRKRLEQQDQQNEMGSLWPLGPDSDSADDEADALDLLLSLI